MTGVGCHIGLTLLHLTPAVSCFSLLLSVLYFIKN